MSASEQATRVKDTVYDLTSVFYHAAKRGTVYARYVADAEKENDQELADFFREVQEQDAQRAHRAKALLVER